MAEQSTKSNYPVFVLMSGYLIGIFLWRVLMRGGEWPLSPSHYLSMGLTLGLVIGVYGIGGKVMQAERGTNRETMATALYWLGLIAGVLTLLIRFTSDAAWWTGHLTN